jgi:hypothetical protein
MPWKARASISGLVQSNSACSIPAAAQAAFRLLLVGGDANFSSFFRQAIEHEISNRAARGQNRDGHSVGSFPTAASRERQQPLRPSPFRRNFAGR